MKDNLITLLKSPEKTNQQLGLSLMQSQHINLDEELWNELREAYNIVYGFNYDNYNRVKPNTQKE